MSEIVTITGKFLDIGGKPLQGTVTIKPAPSYIADSDKVSIYTGSTSAELSDKGELSLPVVSFPEQRYKISFNLRKQGGSSIDIEPQIISVPKADTVSNLLAVTYQETRAGNEPVFEFSPVGSGDLLISGVTVSPDDPGSFVVTLP